MPETKIKDKTIEFIYSEDGDITLLSHTGRFSFHALAVVGALLERAKKKRDFTLPGAGMYRVKYRINILKAKYSFYQM